ncbi:MAG: GtrA family protein [Oscillospiraceae bacterium]|nr:GtrA family protein [Oscillospiraceae bacterium]
MKKISELTIKYKEILVYLIFGVLTTIVSWSTYALFVSLLNLSIEVSNTLSWVCAVLFAFVTNKFFVFESKNKNLKTIFKEFLTFVSSRFLTGVIEIFGVPILVNIGLGATIFGIDGMVAKVLISVIVVILNYIFSKLIVFKKVK